MKRKEEEEGTAKGYREIERDPDGGGDERERHAESWGECLSALHI